MSSQFPVHSCQFLVVSGRHCRVWERVKLLDLQVSRQSVNSIETGEFDPSLTLALGLSPLLEMPIDES